jgi:hypothetical protein
MSCVSRTHAYPVPRDMVGAFQYIVSWEGNLRRAFYDGSVRQVPAQAEEEEFLWTPDFVSPSNPDCYRPQLNSTFRSRLSPECQQKILVRAGPQSICEVIVACYGRDKEWDDICVRALKESVERGVLNFMRKVLEEDWIEPGWEPDLLFQVEGRKAECPQSALGLFKCYGRFVWTRVLLEKRGMA